MVGTRWIGGWAALALLATATGCWGGAKDTRGFIREAVSFDDGFAQGGVPARTLTVRMALERNWDPSATYRLFLDVDQDGKEEHRIETRMEDGRWTTRGGPKGTVGGEPGRGYEAVLWRLPVQGIGAIRSSLTWWVEADTPQGLFRAPQGRGQLHALGRPDWPMSAFDGPRPLPEEPAR